MTPKMTTFGAMVVLASCAVQLILGPLAADCLRMPHADSANTGNRLNNHHAASSRSKRSDPAVREALFAMKLYKHLSAASGEDNVLFSPLSIYTAVSALAEGANDTTAAELLTALNRSAADGPQHRSRMSDVMAQLGPKKTAGPYVLTTANRLFVQQDYRLLPAFLRTMQRAYKMDAVRLDFADSSNAEDAINGWVSQATHRKITALVPPGALAGQTRMVLANAVYFKGDWETTFPEANTRLRPFYYNKDKYVQVSMMSVEADFPYYDFSKMGFEMIELPYSGREVSMFVALPYESQGLSGLARRLLQRPQLLARAGRKMRASPFTVVLPKFAVEESADLKEALGAMGVRRVFEQGLADLSGMTDSRELYVSDVLHKAAVEVSEKGTRAAAATAVVIKGRSMNSDPVFRADRPFLYFIRHNPTESILFLGHVRQLKDEGPKPQVLGRRTLNGHD